MAVLKYFCTQLPFQILFWIYNNKPSPNIYKTEESPSEDTIHFPEFWLIKKTSHLPRTYMFKPDNHQHYQFILFSELFQSKIK